MSLSPNGNKLLHRSYVFEIDDESRVGEVRRRALDLADLLDFTDVRATRLSIVTNELTTNLNRYAKQGKIILRGAYQFGEAFVEILTFDNGPGILDLDRAFTDGVTSGTTPGTGLGAIRRQSDIFDISSSSRGTIAVCEIHANDESAQKAQSSRFRVSGICQPIHGEIVSGDAWSVRTHPQGFEIMLTDGLGHGPVANLAAETSLEIFAQTPETMPLDRKLQVLHGALRTTRGAAVSLASIQMADDSHACVIDFAGVGNVRGVMCEQAREKTLITFPGTIGLQFKPHATMRSPWDGSGAFVMHSDGIQSRWSSKDVADELVHHPGILAAAVFRDYNRGSDDSTVVAAGFFESRT